jgi:2-polyprenyl-3-methyl-5-hydroxy-6-metoxy-1,4-benzoquinol methylase
MAAQSLRERHLQPEIMDRPDLDSVAHHQALDAIERINLISASSQILWTPIRDLCLERHGVRDGRPVRVLDVATGAGDVPSRLWRRAKRKGFPLEVSGCDFSPLAVEHSRRTADRMNADVSFFQLDLMTEPIPTGYDIITCSLFLHHLDEEHASIALTKIREAAGAMALVNDLARSRFGWWAAYLGTRILTRSSIVHFDSAVSVEGAFTPDEALAVARTAGWDGASVKRKFPFRYLLSWRRP